MIKQTILLLTALLMTQTSWAQLKTGPVRQDPLKREYVAPLGTVTIRHEKDSDGKICSKINAPDDITIVGQQPRTPIMGWSSWNTYRVNISDTLIRKQADAKAAEERKLASLSAEARKALEDKEAAIRAELNQMRKAKGKEAV